MRSNTATDADGPSDVLSYQLINPQLGMVINSNGIITWTPTLSQSPSTNLITTVVTDNGVPSLSATNIFSVFVSGPYDGIDFSDIPQAQADIDGDGLSNLMEYALGTDPRNPSDGMEGFQISTLNDGGRTYVIISFKRRKSDPSLQYVPEVSVDMQVWSSDSSSVKETNVTSLDPQFDWVTVQDLTPLTTSAPHFIRLRVVIND